MSLPKLIEIFKSGRHTAASGETISFSDADLEAIAASYDPAVHKAPCVIGHPTDNAPAYAWAAELGVEGTKLVAAVTDINPSFAQAVNKKTYPNRSASFYKPDSPSNPKPGAYYLRHIGFLGAMPPAVKGLAECSFAGGADDFVELSFAEDGAMPAPPGASGGPPDPKKAPPAAPSPEVEAMLKGLPDDIDDATRAKLTKAIEDILAAAKPKDEPLDHAERRKKLEAGELALKASQLAHRRQLNTDYLKGLRSKGVVLPVADERALQFMDLLHAAPADVVSFGESEKRTADQIFREEFLDRIPAAVNFNELAGGGNREDSKPKARELADRATAYVIEQRRNGIHISTAQAVEHVSKG